jgi:hypothetical protein
MGFKETLQNEKTARRVDGSHDAVMEFYRTRNDDMEGCVDTLRGRLYGKSELAAYERTHRQPISINKALAPFRTVMGTITQSGFDADFLPQEESDEELAEALGKLAIYESEKCDDFGQNAQACQSAYAMGRGYRMHWVEQGPGLRPQLRSKVLNPFAVYFDPDSADVVSRGDAKFVDVAHWLSIEEIIEKFPHAEKKIRQSELKDRNLSDNYEHYDKSANRMHEDDNNELNGKRRVVERYYRVSNGGGSEELWLAVWAPGLLYDDTFLFNGAYHVQPIDPDTKKIMFPVVELVSDNMLGESDGFVKFLKDPVKLISVLYTQLIDAAKHSGTGYLANRNAFETDEEFERFLKYGAQSNQRYAVKDNAGLNAVQPIPPSGLPQASIQAMNAAELFVNDMSSAPPALQGQSENSNTPASLNAQRIEQASTQLATFFNFYKTYLRQTLKLRYAYWREAYTEEFTFRVTMPNAEGDGSGQRSFTMNQPAEATGWDGMPTGELRKINDIGAAEFDIVIADSYKAPTFRRKMTAVLQGLLQNPAIGANPEMVQAMVEELLELSDAPHKLKERFRQAAEAQRAQQMQMAQGQQQIQGQAMGTEQLKQMAQIAKMQTMGAAA